MKKAPTIKIDSEKTTPVKKVKRSYKKGAVKAPKTSSSKNTGSSKVKTTKISSPKISSPKKTIVKKTSAKKPTTKKPATPKVKANKSVTKPKRTRAEIQAEAARKRQAKWEAHEARMAERQVIAEERAQEAYEKDVNKQIREQLKYETEKAITEQKLKAYQESNKATYNPDKYEDVLVGYIADKVYKFANTSDDNRQRIADILGIDKKFLDMHGDIESTKERFNYMEQIYQQGKSEKEITKMLRELEQYEREERVTAKGIVMSLEKDAADKIMDDIMGSNMVSKRTKEVLDVLGHKGVLLYLNYRQIMKNNYGDNYKTMFYSQAADTFWDMSKYDKTKVTQYGAKYGKKKAKTLEGIDTGAAMSLDADAFIKFAITTMNIDEAKQFIKDLKTSVAGFRGRQLEKYLEGV